MVNWKGNESNEVVDQVDKLFQQLKMKAEQEWKQIEQLQKRLKEISTEVQEFVETSKKQTSSDNVGDFSSSESEGPGRFIYFFCNVSLI